MQEIHASEWIDRCSTRLQEQWRTVDPTQLDDMAIDLWRDPHWRAMPPEQAAVEWLRQGVLAAA
jgi:hypothetical protein